MKVVIYGANGMLGPYVVRALEKEHRLRLTDIRKPPQTESPSCEYRRVDVSDPQAVAAAAEGMDAVVNLSVSRLDRRLAFDVNTRGCYNIMTAAVRFGIRRVINTGPHFVVTGPTYERFDYELEPNLPPQPGTNLYALSKSLGQEICRIFSVDHDISVITLLFYHFCAYDDHSANGQDITPFAVTWEDAAQAVRCALAVDLGALPSRCEVFNVSADLPHRKFSNEKTKRILNWRPTNNLRLPDLAGK